MVYQMLKRLVIHHPTVKEKKIQKVIGVLIQNIVIEVQKVHQDLGADLLGVDLIPDHTQGLEVWLVHIHGLDLLHLGLIHEISIAIIHRVVDHLHTLLIAVMMEDEPKENLNLVGKKRTLQIKDVAAALRRHLAKNMSKPKTSLPVRESIVKAGHL